MATVVLHATDRFPAATSVSAYALAAGASPPYGGAPTDVAVTSATVATDGSLTFTGLTAEAWFYAYALVSSEHRYVKFSTKDSTVPSESEQRRLIGITGTPTIAVERTFTETAVAGVYTGSVTVPAAATIMDIIVNGVALWDTGTSATMKVGDVADDDGYYTAVNLKATDLLAGESINFALAGGKAGAYIANSQVSPRYAATARVVSGIVTTVGTGTAGRTRMTVIYSLPVADDTAAATKV